MNRIFKYYKDQKGITLVLMAFMLAVLLMLASLAIDIAYMYYVKNQLQVAADAAALAGAAKLTGEIDNVTFNPNVLKQLDARQEAWKFACKNRAAGDPVFLVSQGANCDNPPNSGLNEDNTDTNDIVVGNWNDSNNCNGSKFCPATGSTNLTINALQARPRRTNESEDYGMGPARVFIGQIFRIINADWSYMSAAASAIALRIGLQVLPVAICINQCNAPTDFNDANCPGKKFLSNPPVNSLECAVSGTSIPPATNTNSADLKSFFVQPFPIDICAKCTDTSQGQLTPPVLEAIEAAMARYKTREPITHTNPSNPSENWTATIEGWRVLAPILIIDNTRCVANCSGDCPGDQNANCTYYVPKMAEVIITKIDTKGADSCLNCYGKKWKGLTLVGTIPTATPKVTSIGCLTCDEADELYGKRVRLVR